MPEINKKDIDTILNALFKEKGKDEVGVARTRFLRKRFILNVILTFRLKEETIRELFGLSPDDLFVLYNEVHSENPIYYKVTETGIEPDYYNPISYCLYYDDTLNSSENPLSFDGERFVSQTSKEKLKEPLDSKPISIDWSEQNVMAYFNRLLLIIRIRAQYIKSCKEKGSTPDNKYSDLIIKLYSFVDDSFVQDAIRFIKEKPKNVPVPDEYKEALIRFQNKYAQSTRLMASIINLPHDAYAASIRRYSSEHPDSWYAGAYTSISDYNNGVKDARRRK